MSFMGEVTPDYDGIWGGLDPTGSGFLDLGDEEPHPSVMDSVSTDDFLLMDVDVRLGDNIVSDESSDSGWEFTSDSSQEIHRLPSFLTDFQPGEDDRAPRTPSPPNRSMLYKEEAHQVTPEKPICDKMDLPDMTELQIQYQRTLKKLATSMRRSDETRCIVKRQRLNPTPSTIDDGQNFFSSHRAKAMEESRRKLYEMIRQGAAPGICL